MFYNTIRKMVYKFISYLKFLIKSSNQHGVHSPFVYNFVTKGLYKKSQKSSLIKQNVELQKLSKKKVKILSKIINYFEVEQIYFASNKFRNTENDSSKIVFIDVNELQFLDLKKDIIITITDIYKNKKNTSTWLNFIKDTENIVTVNTYFYGLIFFRPEQAKEHFIIRV